MHTITIGFGRSRHQWSPRTAAATLLGVLCPLVATANGADGPAAVSREIDGVLTRLEKRSEGLQDIRCKIRFEEEDQINLARNVKIGSIRLMVTDANPRAMIHFERVQIDETLRKQEWYLFDGRFWYEAIERLKQVTKREIVREREAFDPFDLEFAPFPMPFGQKKATILRNFSVELIPPSAGDPTNTDHLRLIPKPGSKLERKYDSVDYFVDKDIHLPSLIVARRNDGMEIVTVKLVDLSEQSLNSGLTERDFAPPAQWRDYRVYEELLDDAP